METAGTGSESQQNSVPGALKAALYYISRGWKVIPINSMRGGACSCGHLDCTSPAKHPRTNAGVKSGTLVEATVRLWWNQWPDANIAICTGAASGIVVLDEDPRHGGDESLRVLTMEHNDLPETPISKTGGGGRHFVFAHPGGQVRNAANLRPGLDVRGDDGYVVAPPSTHESGNRYEWWEHGRPSMVAVAPMPEWLQKILKAGAPRKKRAEATRSPAAADGALAGEDGAVGYGARPTQSSVYGLEALRREAEAVACSNDGARNVRLNLAAYLCGQLLGAGYLVEGDVLRELGAAAAAAGLDVRETDRTIHSGLDAGSKIPRSPSGALEYKGHHLTDLGNARRLVAQHGEDVRYATQWRSWIVWDGQRWASDQGDHLVRRHATSVVQELHNEAASAPPEVARDVGKHALRTEAAPRLEAMLSVARHEVGIPVAVSDLDRDPWMLCVSNGVLNLRTGELRPHRREDYATKISAIHYSPNAQAPMWLLFLRQIFASNEDLIAFLRRAVGYSLTGRTSCQCLFLCHGEGANGKSTFLEVISAVAGEYGKTADFNTFLDQRSDSVRNDIAALAGARLVTASEAGVGKALSEVIVKQLTGGDRVTARRLYQDFFEFIPQFKPWLAANQKPRIKGTDHAIWRRIRLIPFGVTIPEKDRNPNMKDMLLSELPGILAWAVQGAAEWATTEDLRPPPCVVEATEGYRREEDRIGEFMAECCVVAPGATVFRATLYRIYAAWAEEQGDRAMSAIAFGRAIGQHGFAEIKLGRAASRAWVGIGLSANTQYSDDEEDDYLRRH